MDVKSFIDFLIINELSRNVDGYRLSSYLFKNKESKGGKLRAGPVWDFNIAYKNANYCSGNSTSGWAYDFGAVCGTDPNQIPFWWAKFMLDQNFKNELKCRWQELRVSLINTTFLNNYIDSVVTLTSEARVRHYDLWPILGAYVWPNPSPIPTTYAGEVTALKNFLNSRIAWLDAAIPGTCTLGTNGLTVSGEEISLFPNPFQSDFYIKFNAEKREKFNIELINSVGEVVHREIYRSSVPGAQQLHITASKELPEGIYLLKIFSESKSLNKKMCLEK